MIKIGTLELPLEMIWSDKLKHQDIFQSSTVTLGGKVLFQALPAVNGRPITLVATERQGWLTTAQVEELLTLANVANATYSFEYYGFIATVAFKHHEPPAVEMQPFVEGGEPSDYHFGSIKLFCV
jgi:hypothetical protein